MESVTAKQREIEHKTEAELALQAMNRGLRKAFLSGEAYDPDGSGRAYWETHDEFCQPITDQKSS